MADHNFKADTYDANTAVLDDCKAYIADVVLPSEPASQFEDIGADITAFVQAINDVLPKVSQFFEEQAYTYRAAKNSICISDSQYASKISEYVVDITTLARELRSMSQSTAATSTIDTVFKCSSSVIAGIYIKYQDLNFDTANDDELRKYIAVQVSQFVGLYKRVQ